MGNEGYGRNGSNSGGIWPRTNGNRISIANVEPGMAVARPGMAKSNSERPSAKRKHKAKSKR